jgi:hypothetical protein
VTRLPPTVRLDAAESQPVEAFIEAIGVGGGVATAQSMVINKEMLISPCFL